jgi:hypothetical membrane protein
MKKKNNIWNCQLIGMGFIVLLTSIMTGHDKKQDGQPN